MQSNYTVMWAGFFFIFIFRVSSEITDNHEIKEANLLFSANLYKTLKSNVTGNFLVSPLSMQLSLSFLQFGGKGKTAEEIRSGLQFSLNEQQAEDITAKLVSLLNINPSTFNLSNILHLDENLAIDSDFKHIATNVYHADSSKSFNEYNIGTGIHFNKMSESIIFNSMSLKANWSNQFNRNITYSSDFYVTPEIVTSVNTLHQFYKSAKIHEYAESSLLNAKFLQMDLQDNDVSLVFALPNDIDGLSRLENQLEDVIKEQIFTSEYVSVGLPTFAIETTLDLNDILKQLGILEAFDVELADFSGIAGNKGDLVVDKIIQKSCIEINEEGVNAAVISSDFYSPTYTPRHKQFIANHPFIFYVKIKDIIVLLGRVTDLRR